MVWETLIKPINIRKRLIFSRLTETIEVDEGDNFNGLFDISAIGGTLTFNLPAITTLETSTGTLNINNLKKFDYIFLYYTEVESDREPKNSEWSQIFGGYIESIQLQKTKDSQSYSITCNSMLALSAYSYFPRPLISANLTEMPNIILQLANLQDGINNDNINKRNIIPSEYMDIQVNDFLGNIYVSNIQETNAKDALLELRNKYGLILTENMDGMVQVTTLTNYVSSANNYEYKTNTDDRSIIERVVNWFDDNYYPYNKTPDTLPTGVISILKVVDIILNAFDMHKTVEQINPEVQNVKFSLSEKIKSITSQNDIIKSYNLHDDLIGKTYEIEDVMVFDIDKNVFGVDYPDVACQYDGVLVYGLFQTGKAIDVIDIIKKDLEPDAITGKINVNMLNVYRRDINSEPELNKIAREKLLEIKQEQKIRIKVKFETFYKIGMPFIFSDGFRYTGDDIFFISRIAYTISKNDVSCIIEGFTSILNTLPESAIIDNPIVADVRSLGLYEKLPDFKWQNF